MNNEENNLPAVQEGGVSLTNPRFESLDELRERCMNFDKVKNRKPRKEREKVNTYANNAKYYEVGFMEMKMDELFLGHWETIPVGQVQVIGNSVVYDMKIRFLHPVTGVWIERAGTGCVEIQLDGNGRAKNKALAKGVGAAKTMAFKNAVKSIGRAFGRDLNRSFEDEYERLYNTKGLNE